MIICNEKKIEFVNNWIDDSFFILIDFDKTLTAGDSWGSWDIILNNKNVSNEYKKEVYNLYNYYRPIEINEKLDKNIRTKFMIDWWNEEVKLFIKYGFDESIINDSLNYMNIMKFREGAKELLINMKYRKIPVIIISAGIGNFIERFLKDNDCYFDNVFVLSNFLKFDNKRLIGFSDNIIHSFNKDIVNLPNSVKELIKLRENILLFGDSITDIEMAKGVNKDNLFSIGFLEENIENNIKYFKESFDLVATNNTSFDELTKKVKILRR